jgi:hypothetical protein
MAKSVEFQQPVNNIVILRGNLNILSKPEDFCVINDQFSGFLSKPLKQVIA